MKQIVNYLHVVAITLLIVGCSKDEKVIIEQARPIDNQETINKMVAITNQQTRNLKEQIASLSSENVRMTTEQYNNFIRENLEQYTHQLIAAEPEYLENDNLQINKVDPENWDGAPDVFEGDAETVVPAYILNRLDAVADRLEAVENNPEYDNEANIDLGCNEIEDILQNEIIAIDKDPNLTSIEKQGLIDAFRASLALVRPQFDFFYTLASGAQILNADMEQWRLGRFFKRVFRAVVRVVIAVVAVAVVTAILVKGAVLFAPFSKFALKIKAKGSFKSILFGVAKKVKPLSGPVINSSFVTPGALLLGGGTGVIKAATKWNTDMSLRYWHKELDFKLKAKVD